MRIVQQIIGGLLIILASGVIIVGGVLLALAEGNTVVQNPTLPPPKEIPPNWTPLPSFTGQPLTPTPPPPFAETPTLLPPATSSCQPPVGWILLVVHSTDTLEGLAQIYRTTVDTLIQGNCLVSTKLYEGVTLYVPILPTLANAPCHPPSGWVQYIIQPGDTLYHLSLTVGATVPELQAANCMGNSTQIQAGKPLWVRYLRPTRTPRPIQFLPLPSSTPAPFFTPTPPATPAKS